ncbi:MAG: hypothetical protein PVI97_03595 [Candidatus Thiodiazotropha sp.]|jgi:hypothetical protein
MSVTLSQSTRLHLRGILDNYMSGRICLDDFVTQAKRGIRQLENYLLTSNGFLRALDAAQHYLPTEGRPIYACTLAYANSYRVTLLGIPISASIPLHDHPNMVSIVAFLSGRIHSPIYRVISKHCEYSLVQLMNCTEQTYSQDDITVLTPDTGNLHSMVALTAEAVCLSIQLSIPSGFCKQSYYFPAVPKAAESGRSLWYRIPFRRYPDGV